MTSPSAPRGTQETLLALGCLDSDTPTWVLDKLIAEACWDFAATAMTESIALFEVRRAIRARCGLAKIPNGLGTRLDRRVSIVRPRILARRGRAQAQLHRPMPRREIARRRIARLIERALSDCAYRRASGRWAGGDHVINVQFTPGRWTSAKGFSEKAWSSNGKWSGLDATWEFQVRPSWERCVARRGLATVRDAKGTRFLTVDAEETEIRPGVVEVTYVKPGRGFDLNTANGFAVIVEGPTQGQVFGRLSAACRYMVTGA